MVMAGRIARLATALLVAGLLLVPALAKRQSRLRADYVRHTHDQSGWNWRRTRERVGPQAVL